MIDKALAKSYSDVIALCKLLKPHATNMMLLDDGLVLLQPTIPGIRNYMISNLDFSVFQNTFFNLATVSSINSKFKKTKSDIDWVEEDSTRYLVISNPEAEPYKIPIFNNERTISELLNDTYSNIPKWNLKKDLVLVDDIDTEDYFSLGEDFITSMNNKELCEINIFGNPIYLSRPFLGSLKKTRKVGIRVVDESDTSVTYKFCQQEELGNIYTYAAFMKI